MASRDHDEPVRAAGALPVASRQTLSGDGRVSRSDHVHCPRREGEIGVATCLACADCDGLVRGPEGDALLCAAAAEPDAPGSTATAAAQVGLAEIMSRDVVCVRDDVSAESLAAMLMDLAITGAPVVDERGRPVGMVSRSDLVQLQLAEEGAAELDGLPDRGMRAVPPSRGVVRDFMMPMTFTLPESASIAHAAALMVYESIHRVPVVATDGSVVGIVSALDVLRWVAVGSGYAVPERRALEARLRR